MFPIDRDKKEGYYAGLTTPELSLEVNFLTSPLRPHEMERSEVEDRFESATLIEGELQQRMTAIRNVNQDVDQNPYLASVTPLAGGELNEEFSQLHRLDAQAHSLSAMYGNELQSRDFTEINQQGHQEFVGRIEAPLKARIEQLEQQHAALQETTADILQTAGEAVTAMDQVQTELAAKGQSVSANWRQSSQDIAQRLRTLAHVGPVLSRLRSRKEDKRGIAKVAFTTHAVH